MKLNSQGTLNRIGKRITPPLGAVISYAGAVNATETLVSYLNLLTGKGSGTGWDDGEEAVAAEIIRNIRPSDPIVIDCGANRGAWMTGVRRLLGGDRGKWLAIEPNPGCFPFLEALPNVEIIRKGAGEVESTQAFYADGDTSGLASLYPRVDTVAGGGNFAVSTIDTVTLDRIIDERQLERVDFLKMDIEGHELFALRGAMKSLRKGRIAALAFEFGAGNLNSRTYFKDFWELLTPLGFRLRRICPGGKTTPILEYYEDLEYFRGVTNYIAVLDGQVKFSEDVT
jgi:FkbM family methyltransferase